MFVLPLTTNPPSPAGSAWRLVWETCIRSPVRKANPLAETTVAPTASTLSPEYHQGPRRFDLGRFSNAGRPPTKTPTSRRDPHQKTFTKLPHFCTAADVAFRYLAKDVS